MYARTHPIHPSLPASLSLTFTKCIRLLDIIKSIETESEPSREGRLELFFYFAALISSTFYTFFPLWMTDEVYECYRLNDLNNLNYTLCSYFLFVNHILTIRVRGKEFFKGSFRFFFFFLRFGSGRKSQREIELWLCAFLCKWGWCLSLPLPGLPMWILQGKNTAQISSGVQGSCVRSHTWLSTVKSPMN